MGTFSHPIEVFSADGSRSIAVEALVDTGATYTGLPGAVLRGLGLAPDRKIPARLVDDSAVEDEIGEVRVRLQGIELTTIVVFDAATAPARLGAYTLTGAGLAVDPVVRRLIPALVRRHCRRALAA